MKNKLLELNKFLVKTVISVTLLSMSLFFITTETVEISSAQTQESYVETGEYSETAEVFSYAKDNISISVSRQTGFTTVLDKNTGNEWHSNPSDFEDDFIARDRWKTNLRSQFEIMYFDKGINAIKYSNSYLIGTRDNKLDFEKVQSGFKIIYNLESLGMSLPLELTIENNSIKASMKFSEQTLRDKYELISISILPFFGAGKMDEKGYILVPGGMGGIINFNNGKYLSGSYRTQIYGKDMSIVEREMTVPEETARLPLYAIMGETGGIFAVIGEGAQSSEIIAAVSQVVSTYNIAYPLFNVRSTDRYYIRDATNQEREYIIYDDFNLEERNFEITYYLLDSDTTLYEMANIYADSLGFDNENNNSNINNSNVNFTFLGGTLNTSSFLGFNIQRPMVTSTIDGIIEFVSEIKNSGTENIGIILENFSRNSIYGKIEKRWSVLRNAGSRNNLDTLKSEVGNENLVISVNNTRISNKSIFTHIDQVRTISGQSANNYRYNPETKQIISSSAQNILNPGFASALFENFTTKTDNSETLLFRDIGKFLFSDFSSGTSRGKTAGIWSDLLKNETVKGKMVSCDGGNSYLLPYVNTVYDSPVDTSDHIMIDYAYPFYQMVISGKVGYVSESVNRFPNSNLQFLKSIQTGSGINFTFMTENKMSEIKSTDFSEYYSSDIGLWKKDAIEYSKKFSDYMKTIGGHKLTDFKILADGVTQTVFGDKISVIVNFNNDSYEYMSDEIPANDFRIYEGSQR